MRSRPYTPGYFMLRDGERAMVADALREKATGDARAAKAMLLKSVSPDGKEGEFMSSAELPEGLRRVYCQLMDQADRAEDLADAVEL